MPSCRGLLLAPALLLCACEGAKSESKGSSKATGGGADPVLLGVPADKWSCDLVATPEAIAQAVGKAVKPIDSPFTPPRGVPKPCSYLAGADAPAVGDAGAPAPEAWTFDVDCREDYDKRAEILFAQYAKTSAELVDQYKQEAGDKPIVTDAGVTLKAPTGASDVALGRRALDHHGQGLLFVDDDSPCYVRIVGPGADRRLALGELLAKNLREANAPMTPHVDPVMKGN
jgi:hypothetical protein